MTALAAAVANSLRPDIEARTAESSHSVLGRRSLSQVDLFAQALATTAPAAGIVSIPILFLAAGGTATALVLLLGALALLAGYAWVTSQFTRRVVSAGGMYSFAAVSGGRVRGVAVGLAMLAKLVGSAALTVYGSLLAAERALDLVGAPDFAGRRAVLTAGFLAVAGLVVGRGVRVAMAALLVLEVASIVLMFGVLAFVGVADSVPEPADSTPHTTMLALVALFSLAGFETVTYFAPEARNPHRSVTRVVLIIPVISGLVVALALVLTATGAADGLLGAYLHPEQSTAPIALLVAIQLAVGASMAGSAIASFNAVSRLLFALGLDGVVPPRLAAVSETFRTPIAALTAAVAAVAVIVVVISTGAMNPDLVRELVRTAIVAAFAVLGVCLIDFLRRIEELTRATIVVATITAAAGFVALAAEVGYQLLHGQVAIAVILVALGGGAVAVSRTRSRGGRAIGGPSAVDAPETAELLPGAFDVVRRADGRSELVGARGFAASVVPESRLPPPLSSPPPGEPPCPH